MPIVHKICYSKKQFIWFMQPLEEFAVRNHGYTPGIISAQAALETKYGKKVIDRNLFNIKATKRWKGPVVHITTHEYIKGKKIKIVGKFRGYNCYYDSLRNYMTLMKTKRYEICWALRKNPPEYFKALQVCGYATDPRYPESLMRRYEALQKVNTETLTFA